MNKDLKGKFAFTLAEGATHVGISNNIDGTLHRLVKSFTHVGISNNIDETLHRLVKSFTHVGIFHNTRRVGFTLAEVLITLGIIGVVSAMTIPTLVANYQQKSMDTKANTFNRRLGEALKVMNSQSVLAGHNSTGEFVNELSKHIKILKVCESTKLKECFVEEFATNEDSYKVADLQQGKNLNQEDGYKTSETLGVLFGDGTSALLAYNKKAKEDPFNNRIVNVNSTGTGLKNRTIGLSTDALAILYDVSGSSGVNTYGTGDGGKLKDIRGINVTLNIGGELLEIGMNYAPIDCLNPNAEGYEYCTENEKIAPNNGEHPLSYFAGAKYACAQVGMKVPTYSYLYKLYDDGLLYPGVYITSEEDLFNPGYAGGYHIVDYDPDTFYIIDSGIMPHDEQSYLLCIAD